MLGWAIAFIMAAVLVALVGLGETTTTLLALTKVLFFERLVEFVWFHACSRIIASQPAPI